MLEAFCTLLGIRILLVDSLEGSQFEFPSDEFSHFNEHTVIDAQIDRCQRLIDGICQMSLSPSALT